MANDRTAQPSRPKMLGIFSPLLRFIPLAYFGFLSLWALISLVAGAESVSMLLAAPFIYAYVAPALVLLILPLASYAASLLYWDWRLFESGYRQMGRSVVALIFAFLFIR